MAAAYPCVITGCEPVTRDIDALITGRANHGKWWEGRAELGHDTGLGRGTPAHGFAYPRSLAFICGSKSYFGVTLPHGPSRSNPG